MNNSSPGYTRILTLAVTVLLVLALGLAVLSRQHFLDDAFIHLRIAYGLLDRGNFAYNEGLPGFSTSSPLYTTMTAAVSLILRAPFVPKVVNLSLYAVMVALVAWRLPSCANPLKAFLWLGALGVIVSPFGVRWLTDGMETGLVMLTAILLAVATDTIGRGAASLRGRAATVVVGAAAVLLRVEFGYVLAVAIAALAARRLVSRGDAGANWKNAVTGGLPFILGGLLGSATILAVFGHLLPDTAVAKQSQVDPPLAVLKTVLFTHAGASLFGIGMFAVWLTSAVSAFLRGGREVRAYLLVANTSLIVFIGLLIVTGQTIQGVRYFVFIEAFLGALNILSLNDEDRHPVRAWWVVLLGGVFAGWFCCDLVLFQRILAGRSETYRRFVGSDYTYLANHKGIAYDIGFVGYFTRGYVLDPHGLVNGRAMAKLTMAQRLTEYATEPVDFVFVNEGQRHQVQQYLDVSNWREVGSFDFPNSSGPLDTHWLLVRPEIVPAGSSRH